MSDERQIDGKIIYTKKTKNMVDDYDDYYIFLDDGSNFKVSNYRELWHAFTHSWVLYAQWGLRLSHTSKRAENSLTKWAQMHVV